MMGFAVIWFIFLIIYVVFIVYGHNYHLKFKMALLVFFAVMFILNLMGWI